MKARIFILCFVSHGVGIVIVPSKQLNMWVMCQSFALRCEEDKADSAGQLSSQSLESWTEVLVDAIYSVNIQPSMLILGISCSQSGITWGQAER